MSLIATLSQRELLFQAASLYEGLDYKLFAALNPGSLTAQSDLDEWEAVEVTTNGAAPATGVVPAASYNATTGRVEVPVLTLTLEPTGAGFSFNAIVCQLEGRTNHPHSVLVFPETVLLAAAQNRSYRVRLVQDD